MSGLNYRNSDREARQRAQVVLTQDEYDKMMRAQSLGVPEQPRGYRGVREAKRDHWSPPKDDIGLEKDRSI